MTTVKSTRPQMIGQAKETYDQLPSRMRMDIDDWLEDRPTKVLYGRFEVLDAWLEWNGILGYDQDFRDLFDALK